jgi:hypothetical protein
MVELSELICGLRQRINDAPLVEQSRVVLLGSGLAQELLRVLESVQDGAWPLGPPGLEPACEWRQLRVILAAIAAQNGGQIFVHQKLLYDVDNAHTREALPWWKRTDRGVIFYESSPLQHGTQQTAAAKT